MGLKALKMNGLEDQPQICQTHKQHIKSNQRLEEVILLTKVEMMIHKIFQGSITKSNLKWTLMMYILSNLNQILVEIEMTYPANNHNWKREFQIWQLFLLIWQTEMTYQLLIRMKYHKLWRQTVINQSLLKEKKCY